MSSTNLVQGKTVQQASIPNQIKSRYLQVQYALFLANAHWGAHRKAAQQYIVQQYPAHEARDILQWITPVENFIDGKKGARFSKTNTNQPYTEIRGVTGRCYELLNTPKTQDLGVLAQVLPVEQKIFQESSLILGVGGEGVVRMAREVESQTFFAVKKNRRIHCAEIEATQLKLVDDPRYFISLEDAIIVKGSRSDNKAYHLMPYFQMDGFRYIEALQQNRIKANQGQREVWAKEVATQMVGAVCALHGLDRYHRDIKPENFLVKVKPGTLSPEKVVLSDFSFSDANRFIGKQYGTQYYMPPEIFQATWCDSLYHDAFSLGVTLHQLYFGLYHTYALNLSAKLAHGDGSIPVDGSVLAHIVYLLTLEDPARRSLPKEVRMLPYFTPHIYSEPLDLLASGAAAANPK